MVIHGWQKDHFKAYEWHLKLISGQTGDIDLRINKQ